MNLLPKHLHCLLLLCFQFSSINPVDEEEEDEDEQQIP